MKTTINFKDLCNPKLSQQLRQTILNPANAESLTIISGDPFAYRYVTALCQKAGRHWRALSSIHGAYALEITPDGL